MQALMSLKLHSMLVTKSKPLIHPITVTVVVKLMLAVVGALSAAAAVPCHTKEEDKEKK